MHNVSKKFLVKAIIKALDIEALKGNSILLTTSSGVITGTCCCSEYDEGQGIFGSIVATVKNTYEKCYEELCEEKLDEGYTPQLPEIAPYIVLDNVTLFSQGQCFTLEQMLIFLDDITGISIGKAKM